jgi:dipeptidyl aminopeptidase/acylaminoacyl peptidase
VLQWSWSLDGAVVIYAADPDQTLQPDYFLYDVATDGTSRITDDPGFVPTAPPPPPVWLDSDRVLVEAQRAGASELVVLHLRTGVTETLLRSEARHTSLSVDLRRAVAVQAEASPTSYGEISVVDLSSRARTTVTRNNTELLGECPPALWERFQVTADGGPIDAWMLKPAHFDPAKKYPVVLDVHGGPTGHYGSNFMTVQQCLASHGFLVVYANCRGSSSYGREFARANIRDWGGGDFRDYMAVVDAVLENDFADGERTGIYGYSYGGYMTAWTIGQTHRFAAAVCGAPLFDLESYWGTSDVGHRGLEKYAGGPPHLERDWYAEHSPSSLAHLATTPTLVIQGEEDHRCPIGQGQQMFVALRRVGCEAELALYPGSSHLFLFDGAPAARHDFLTRILDWFSEHLGAPASTGGTPATR